MGGIVVWISMKPVPSLHFSQKSVQAARKNLFNAHHIDGMRWGGGVCGYLVLLGQVMLAKQFVTNVSEWSI